MEKHNYFIGVLIIVLFALTVAFVKKQTEPWNPNQLMEPKELAAVINDPHAIKPLIISVGPAGLIKGSIEAGPANEGLSHLKKILSGEIRERRIVIYCGCCPFKDCPNIRPAFSLLKDMKFTNHKLLNVTKNLRVDWIDRGYPMTDTK